MGRLTLGAGDSLPIRSRGAYGFTRCVVDHEGRGDRFRQLRCGLDLLEFDMSRSQGAVVALSRPMNRATGAVRSRPESELQTKPGRLTNRQLVVLAAPPLLVATTYLAFQAMVEWLGFRWGYLGGFLFFWIVWCWGFTLWAVGREGMAAVLREVRPHLPRPTGLWLALLAFPVAGGFATVLLPDLPDATLPVVGLALVIAAVNSLSEEVFWRGLFVRMLPERRVLGWLYPAAWFSLWHIAPTSVFGSTWVLVTGAAYLGLVYGWIAWSTGTVRYTIVAHFLVNAMGLGFATLLLQP